MATTQILLREDVDNLGGRGDLVKVKAGYARNWLIPQGLAMPATKGNIKQVERERSFILKKVAVEKSTADAQKEQMKDISLTFERKAGEHGLLFGSVTSMDIAEALQAKGYEIDRKKIVLKDNLKELGEYTVNLKLHRDVVLEIPVNVVGEGGEVAAKVEETKVEEAPAETTEKTTEV